MHDLTPMARAPILITIFPRANQGKINSGATNFFGEGP